MSIATSRYRDVRKYFYAIAILVALVIASLIGALYVTQEKSGTAHERVAVFHLASVALTSQLADSSRSLAGGGAPALWTDSSGVVYAMRAQLNRLIDLQNADGDPRFKATLERVANRIERLEQLLGDAAEPQTLVGQIDSLALSVEQLSRLHAHAAEETLVKFHADQHFVARFVIVLGIVLGLGIALVFVLIRMLRATLSQQIATEDALAASQERMHHMQKLDALGRLVGGVAHDFNNLLTAILGHVTLLQARGGLDEETGAALNQVQQASEQAAALTQQLLAFSRLQKVEPRVIDLNALVRNVEPLLRRLIGEDVRLRVECAEIACAVELDPGQAQQVIMNLVVNARDAMPGGGSLLISTASTQVSDARAKPDGLPPGRYVSLSVSDTGVGINPELQKQIFDPFFTTKPKGRGTGLGLSMVHGIVTEARGHIVVDSRPGSGTRIDIHWPRSSRQPQALSSDAAVKPAETGDETVLVVEDEEQIRSFLDEGLTHLGYRVLTAASGAEGLWYCRSEPGQIDVILSDVIMGDMNGSQFMLQALEHRGNAVAFYMSGYTDEIVLQGGVTGADVPLIHKPFTLDEISRCIRSGLDARDAQPCTTASVVE